MSQTARQGEGDSIQRDAYDDYEAFRRAGSAGAYARLHGLDQLPWAVKMMEHPAYDAFWQGQALDKLIAQHPPQVPTMWLQGLWDQEDMWGAIHCYLALKAKNQADHNYLVMGPWFHSQVNREGYNLGPLRWDGDTTAQFRRDVLKPFFDQYLKTGAPKADTPPVLIYNTGENHWDRLRNWPLACEKDCAAPLKPLYLQADFGLGFDKPAASGRCRRFLRFRSRQARAIYPAAGALRRFRPVADMAGLRSAHRRRSHGRADVPIGRAHRAGAYRRRAHRRTFRGHHRHGCGLGGQADRRLSR